MRFLKRSEVANLFLDKRVAIVGSGPGVLQNEIGKIDGYDIVVRVNNYKLSDAAGFRTDVHYSFYGTSIRKTADELKRDGVWLCMCKCPDAEAIDSEWHRRHNMMIGVDYRPHYRRRREFWFCDTYIPEKEWFVRYFEILGRHIPTTGFAAVLDISSFFPREIYLTGFDFFTSRIHNVDEPWKARHRDDPICHVPEGELAWIKNNLSRHPFTFDQVLSEMVLT
jgi:hypothetical protein